MGIVVLVLLVALLVAGLWLLIAGLRGDRVPEHTVCRACRFDLRGVEPVKCPECGADLAAPRAMALVRRRRNSRRAWTGAVLTLLALAVPVALLIDAAASGRLSAHLPTPVLAFEMRLMGDRTPVSVTNELIKRCAAGEVSDSTLRTVAIAVTRMRSGDETLAPALNALVGDATAKGLISKDVLAAHVVVPRLMETRVPERMHVGGTAIRAPVNLGDASRLPADGVWLVSRRIVAVEVNGKRLPSSSIATGNERQWLNTYSSVGTTTTHFDRPGGSDVQAVPMQPELPVGRHTVRLHFCIEVFRGAGDRNPGVVQASRDYDIEVLAKDEPLVRQFDDASLRRALTQMVQPDASRFRGSYGWSIGQGVTALPKDVLPLAASERVGGAWDVVFEVQGEEPQTVGRLKVSWKNGIPHVFTAYDSKLRLPAGVATVKVVLVPNGAFAAERDAIDVMPAGEIVYEDVPVN